MPYSSLLGQKAWFLIIALWFLSVATNYIQFLNFAHYVLTTIIQWLSRYEVIYYSNWLVKPL